MNLNPKVLVVSNNNTFGPQWNFSQLEKNVDLVLESNPGNFIQRSETEAPNLIVVDMNDHGSSILNIIKSRGENPDIPVLFLTQNTPEEYLMQAYDAGVDECVVKPISPSIFHAKINAWLRRSRSIPVPALESLKIGRVNLIPSERTLVLDNGNPIHLTTLELRVLYILMSRPGRTVSAVELNQRVWGVGQEGDNTVLKNTIYRLRKKAELDPAHPLLIQTVAGVGYKIIPE